MHLACKTSVAMSRAPVTFSRSQVHCSNAQGVTSARTPIHSIDYWVLSGVFSVDLRRALSSLSNYAKFKLGYLLKKNNCLGMAGTIAISRFIWMEAMNESFLLGERSATGFVAGGRFVFPSGTAVEAVLLALFAEVRLYNLSCWDEANGADCSARLSATQRPRRPATHDLCELAAQESRTIVLSGCIHGHVLCPHAGCGWPAATPCFVERAVAPCAKLPPNLTGPQPQTGGLCNQFKPEERCSNKFCQL